MMACILSCLGGFVECDKDLLLHHSPFVKELLGAVTCSCTGPVLVLPDIGVETICLALNLLVGSGGKEVVLEHEELQPAAIAFSMLGISFSYSFSKIQVSHSFNLSILNSLPWCGGGAV